MAHHHCFPVVFLHLVRVTHLIHAYYLPIIAFPKDSVESAQQHLYVILLWSHVPYRCALRWYPDPSVNALLKPYSRVVPLISLGLFASEEGLDFLRAGNWSLRLSWLLLLWLFTKVTKIEITQTTHQIISSHLSSWLLVFIIVEKIRALLRWL